jgi:hypothetical protein
MASAPLPTFVFARGDLSKKWAVSAGDTDFRMIQTVPTWA